ncbi:MAG: hypothetical protein IJC59_08065 [Lachnospiraceae bacterium]|nr:hypothetical protein [Lachnospiraceae bacterium]
MMYLHYCKDCKRLHLLNGHKLYCPKCRTRLNELQMPYMEYITLSSTERSLLTELCGNDEALKELSTTYRMYKYNKSYKQASNL